MQHVIVQSYPWANEVMAQQRPLPSPPAGGLKCLLFQDWNISPGLSYDTARSPPLPPRQSSSVASAGELGGGGAAAAGAYSGGRVGLPTLLQQRVRYTLAIQKNPQVRAVPYARLHLCKTPRFTMSVLELSAYQHTICLAVWKPTICGFLHEDGSF